MDPNYLDFEQPIAELQAKVRELRHISSDDTVNISEAIEELERKNLALTQTIFSKLTDWQITQMARHPQRPYTRDYIDAMLSDFLELAGDRHFADDLAIIGGMARLDGRPVMVIGHQKGRDVKEKVKRNFGMARPEGYRKALRLMKLAEKFHMPVLTFIDTPGAYPGIDAEERNQSEAIARNLFEMSQLRVPVICTIIGEGGSGGALAIGVGDRMLMLQYSVYSVISPEGCASILWKDASRAAEAAEALKITAPQLHNLGLIDEIVEEPLGGAHRDVGKMANQLKGALAKHLAQLDNMSMDEMLESRMQRLLDYGVYNED
ncbi:MAG: acetyl-CoA carboxylase carboxyltransferase subunit alpha [Gammaproteobacteria bacterium]|nr:MAG: acetyl-CoA carboxylase carboxyltransferase subunit alpha [Gammaproteobacteria bacterium]